MRRLLRPPIVLAAVLGVAVLAAAASAIAVENINPVADGSKYAFGENAGWLNAEPSGNGGPGLEVTNTDVKGYLWGENIGWINANCSTNALCGGPAGVWGVTNDGAGGLKGYAWSENEGWINFSCQTNSACAGPAGNWGVKIHPTTGVFSGQAWGENIGWVTFSCPGSAGCGPVAYQVQTSWTCPDNDAALAFAWIKDGIGPEGAVNIGCDSVVDPNDDNDLRCTDVEELGGNIDLGGTRDPLNPWDFADVPAPALPMAGALRNGAISLADVGATLTWVSRVNNGPPDGGGHDYDDDNNANGVEDGAEYDRTPAGALSGPPNGAISLSDVGVVLNQVGDNCTASPN